MPRHFTFLPALVLLAITIGEARAEPITFELDTYIATVAGNPFGLDNSARLETVLATVTYDSTVVDINASATRGDYPHAAGGAFMADILGISITGSATPFVQIEDLNPDTFRFIDGPRTVGPAGGIMSVDGVANPDTQLFIAFTDSSGAAFMDDALPNPLPFAVPPLSEPSPFFFPHTISLSDSGGTLLLQLNDINMLQQPPGPGPDPSVPEPASVWLWGIVGLGMAIAINRRVRAQS